MINVGIIGATGYTGLELARLLLQHSQAKITLLTSEKSAGASFSSLFPAFKNLIDLNLESFDAEKAAKKIDVAFLCLPHQSAMDAAAILLKKGLKVIDLSADFRLKSAKDYEQWYDKHKYPDLLKDAVYGLPELYREKIKSCKFVANPGCYPTSAALALAPLIKEKIIELDSIIIDSKSGVSGAGRTANTELLFTELSEGFKAYKVAQHRHTPEIEQTLSDLAGQKIKVSFTPHLIPINRGILTTVYAQATKKIKTDLLISLYKKFYQSENFVRIHSEGIFPNTKDVRGTNYCDLSVVYDERVDRIIALSAIDNLTKGASGQALQNFNLMMGFEESLGLNLISMIP